MKPILLILENPGNDYDKFLSQLVMLYPKYSIQKTVCKEEEKYVKGIVHVKKILSSEILSRFSSLKFIATAFTGYDSVDAVYCKKNGIVVYNVPEYSTNSVAELTLAMAITCLRNIPESVKNLSQGGWDSIPGRELHGKKVTIIGTGATGCRTAALFKAFGCHITGHSRSQRSAFIKLGGNYAADLVSACRNADIISIHIPLNAETKGLFNAEILSTFNKKPILINTSRGAIIDRDSLLNALDKNTISRTALDVFDTEPLANDDIFRNHPRIFATPHIAFKTEEALRRKADITIENINAYHVNSERNRVI